MIHSISNTILTYWSSIMFVTCCLGTNKRERMIVILSLPINGHNLISYVDIHTEVQML